MRTRKPKFDFSNTPARWTNNGEFAHSMNATSTVIPSLERFLNRVMAKAHVEIKGDDAETTRLRADITDFIKQETVHYTNHAKFNQILKRCGYEKIPEFEAEAAADYARLLKTKSFAFQCAFCEGFETLGPPSALAWLDEMEDMLVGADPEAVKLWKWHIMEEYEHRTVCHDVFKRIHGGYFLRIFAFFYQMRHMFGFSARVQAYLLSEDRKAMSAEEIKESKRREKQASRQMMTRILLRSIRALSPWYTPRNSPEPRNWQAYRNQIEAGLEAPG